MIRIYNPKRSERISNNLCYTDNPHLYNMNDWVVVDRSDVSNVGTINPYVYVSRYTSNLKLDDEYEIIICTSQAQLQELVKSEFTNKVIYVLHGMSEIQIENAMPALVINTFAKKQQIKVNHRNLYMTGSEFGYSLQLDHIFHYQTYAFLKLEMTGNNCVYISSEIECGELYTKIGVINPIDISQLEKIDNNIIEFTIADRFNKYSATSNLVLDLDFHQITKPVNTDFNVSYLSFVRKAYLSITGINNEADFKFISGAQRSVEPGKTNYFAFKQGDVAIRSANSNALVSIRNYITEIASFKLNIKRQKKAPTVDNSTRLIIIYDPNDRGFINALERSNAFEVAFNKLFSFEQYEQFAINYAKQLGIDASNIIYLLDDTVETDRSDVYITSSLSIKNSIRYQNQQFNFTNVKISQITTQGQLLFISDLNYNKEKNLYEIIIPTQFKGKHVFFKLGGRVERFEAAQNYNNRIGFFPSFFTEVLKVDGSLTLQIAIIDNLTMYVSNSYQVIVDDDQIQLDYNLSDMCIYTVVVQEQLTTKHLQKIQEKYSKADIRIVKYGQEQAFEQYVYDTFGLKDLSIDEYACLYPPYLKTKGYQYVSYIADGTIYDERSLMCEIDNNLLAIRTVITDDYQMYIPHKVNYFTIKIDDYVTLITELRQYRIIGNEIAVSTVEKYNGDSPVIDFVHKFNPWDENNLQVFKQYTEEGIFINSELIGKLVDNTNLPIYPIPRNQLIYRNNLLLNIGQRQMKLSIIITTYCNGDVIFDTLKYIVDNIALVARDYEILIFDDCSADDTIERIDQFFAVYPHVNNTVKVNPRNMRYPGYGANSGIRIARGKYVHIVDGDDKVLNGIYSVLNRRLVDEDVISFGHYNYDVSRNEFIQGRYYSFNEFTDSFPYQKSKQEFKMLQANVTHWNKFFKTSFLRDNSLYYLENQLVQDSAFLTDVYYCKPTTRHIPEIGYIYHIGHESVSSGRKGYKLFVDFVNANMKRTPLVDSFFPQYTYTMKRFMIYDEIKDQELEAIVDLLEEKYASNYRIGDINFFNKGQLLHKMMHDLITNREYDRIRQFLKITEEFKLSSEYHDSKYYDLFMGINKLNVVGHFIVNIKLVAALYKERIEANDLIVIDQFILYYNAVRPQIEKELTVLNQVYSENPDMYQNKFDYITTNLEQALKFVYNLNLDIAKLEYNLLPLTGLKTKSKIVVLKNANKYIINQLRLIDPDMTIYQLGGEDSQIVSGLAAIYSKYCGAQVFSLILDGSSDIDFNNLFLIYHTAYSTRYGLICLTGDEDDDMFNVCNRYLVNIDMFNQTEYSCQSIFKIEHSHKSTVKIELTTTSSLFKEVSLIASGYGNINTKNMELLNKLYHTSPTLRTISYHKRREANRYLFDFNVEEGRE